MAVTWDTIQTCMGKSCPSHQSNHVLWKNVKLYMHAFEIRCVYVLSFAHSPGLWALRDHSNSSCHFTWQILCLQACVGRRVKFCVHILPSPPPPSVPPPTPYLIPQTYKNQSASSVHHIPSPSSKKTLSSAPQQWRPSAAVVLCLLEEASVEAPCGVLL